MKKKNVIWVSVLGAAVIGVGVVGYFQRKALVKSIKTISETLGMR